jgi:hypothetical protein
MWTYEISTGRIFDADGLLAGTGYSGAPLNPADPEDEGKPGYINDPADEDLKARGPIPKGFYTIGPARNHEHLGPIAMPLTPDPDNVEYGRSDFWMHGDSIKKPGTASRGCIIQHHDTRLRVATSGDTRLQAVDFLPPTTPTATDGF